jgi:AraC family transcriptional regulator, regulatory protein of adaptative response / methylated-DNA-[protein]-cysteine methyltransferase
MEINTITQQYITGEQRWQAFASRDKQADGQFFIGVKTTGIFCRVLCPARLPKRENIRFFDTWQEAEAAGFRTCKRCHPKELEPETPHRSAVIHACEILDSAETQPTLEALAKMAGLSPFHFQRVFKGIVGVSPKQYYMEKRSSRIRQNLQQTSRVTDAIYDAGFGSSARFYSQAGDTLGMKPSDFQKGGDGMEISFAISPSYLGLVLVAATVTGVCLIIFGDQPEVLEEELYRRFPKAHLKDADATFKEWVNQVISYLQHPGRDLNLPLDIQGTAFQRRVWAALREIPTGSTASYSEVASRIGNPKAVRAVANACAANHLAVAIPCHRVVRLNGGLGGYHWGLERKHALLEHEKKAA